MGVECSRPGDFKIIPRMVLSIRNDVVLLSLWLMGRDDVVLLLGE